MRNAAARWDMALQKIQPVRLVGFARAACHTHTSTCAARGTGSECGAPFLTWPVPIDTRRACGAFCVHYGLEESHGQAKDKQYGSFGILFEKCRFIERHRINQ